MRIRSILCLALLVWPLVLRAQSGEVRRLLKEAETYVQQGDWRAAERTYRAVLLRHRDHPEALRGLARMAMQREDWKEATRRWKALLRQHPDDLEGWYGLALADRELGVHRPPLYRGLLPWKEAEKAFEEVLRRDTLYRDVLYQYALLRRYQGRYEEAMELALQQVARKPEHVEAVVGLFALGRFFLRNAPRGRLQAYLKAHAHHPVVRYLEAEALRMQGQLEAAEARLRALISEAPDMPLQPVYLSLARIHYARGEIRQGEAMFWEAVARIRSRAEAYLVLEDVKYILTDGELEAFEELQTPAAYRTFFETFWMQHHPLPAAPINFRLAEHYRRLLVAERYFVYDGFRTWFNNPDRLRLLNFPRVYRLNRVFNDKGLIFLRYGEPDERIFTLGEDLPSNETWRYAARGDRPELIFHFMVDATGGAGNNWRLVPYLDDPRMLQDRVHLGRLYHRFLRMEDPIERERLLQEMADESREAVHFAFAHEAHRWPDTLHIFPLHGEVAVFQDVQGRMDVRVFYLLPGEVASRGPTEVRLAVLKQYRRVRALEHRIPLRTEGHGYVGGFALTLPADTYRVSLYAGGMGHAHLGGWWQELPVISGKGLWMSPPLPALAVRPATDETPAAFRRGDLELHPNPTHRFPGNRPLHLYFEIYGLTPDATGSYRYEVTYRLVEEKAEPRGIEKVLALFRRGPRTVLTLEVPGSAHALPVREHPKLDVRAVPEGRYRLDVEVHDRVGHQHVRAQTRLEIRKSS